LEADRRLIEERIKRIEKQLDSVVKTRTLHRKGRARVPYPTIALVGYTNAGKSTLFNTLTRAEVLAKDLLFATLDPTMRVIALPHGRKAILSDTVGFISELPTSLIAAFRATLEEVIGADLVLHVRDISHSETEEQATDVARVLGELGIGEARADRIIEVWNKADLLEADARAMREAQAHRHRDRVLVSAVTHEGLPRLLSLIEDKLGASHEVYQVYLDAGDGEGQAWLHDRGEVLAREDYPDGRLRLTVRLSEDKAGQAHARFGRSMRAEGKLRAAAE
jgi:GTP-binding protein HflX